MRPVRMALAMWLVLIAAGCQTFPLRTPRLEQHRSAPPWAGQTSLRVRADLPHGTIVLGAGDAGRLYELDMTWDAANQQLVERVVGHPAAQLDLRLSGTFTGGENRLSSIFLNPQLPAEIELTAGAGDTRVNLAGLDVRRVNLRQGVGRLIVSAGEVATDDCDVLDVRCGVGEAELLGLGDLVPREFRFRGGMGSATIGFDGAGAGRVEGRLEIGVGDITLILNDRVATRLRHRGGPGKLNLPPSRFTREGGGNSFVSGDMEGAELRLDLEVISGIGGLSVTFQ